MSTNVLNLPGNYLIKALNGTVTIDSPATTATGSLGVLGDTVLGATNTSTIKATAQFISDLIPQTSSTYSLGTETNTWLQLNAEQARFYSVDNVGNPVGRPYDPADIYDTLDHRTTASVYVTGGVGIEKDLNVGGYIYGRIDRATTASNIVTTATNDSAIFYPTFVSGLNSGTVYIDNTGLLGGLTYNPGLGTLTTEKVRVSSTSQSTSTTTGALVVDGGAGIAKNLVVGETIESGDILPHADYQSTTTVYSIGTTGTQWAEAYVKDIYTKVISSTVGPVQISPEGQLTEIIGDIRVRGTNPIGTAPVVTNILYVTMDGDDTNDGRAEDASRACRTVGGAINSPYYQSGTQIRVAPGHYLEDNPLQLKPYTSIMGSDLRTTSIEPINKTQDLFHMNSGCYLAFMQFLNGRSGLLEGDFTAEFNRGAYATAFPPLPEGERIDLYHSPYIQNCTNLSGPWLKDGTMFVPNQTIQVPAAVGTGTWAANTTSIVVKSSIGTIARGMSVNAGQQNPGFFNARTLMLANKPFLQEQTVNWITRQVSTASVGSVWYNFTYNKEKCRRDVGILVENISYDAAFGGNQKAVESGLAYYDGVVSLIAGQEIQTTRAIEYLRDLSTQVVTNTACTNIVPGVNSQVINWVLTGGAISTASIRNLFGIVTATISNPANSPDIYKSTGPDAAFVSAETLMQANRTFIQENTLNYVNNELCFPPKNLKFNKIKCRRDIGLIVDSVALDMLYPTTGHSQSTFAGLRYFSQDKYVGDIPNEITTTTAAVVYLKELAVKIIQNITPSIDLVNRYQSVVPQVTNLEPASEDEVAIIRENFDIVLDIMRGNYTGWSDKIISNGKTSNLKGVQNAVALLRANKENGYLGAEVIAYITATYPTFTAYDVNKCKRDVGYIVDSISFDLLHGGNRQSVQSGLSYYGFNSSRVIRDSERSATIESFGYISTLSNYIIQGITVPTIYQTKIKQYTTSSIATPTEATSIAVSISTITNIIANGTSTAVWGLVPISTATNSIVARDNAFDLLMANKEFIKAEVIAYLDQKYNPNSFTYDEEKCYRDVGLIVDAVSQDILLGGNYKTIEAGVSYWNGGYNHVLGQVSTTTAAISYARDLALEVIANRAVTTATTVKLQTGTVSTQVINTFFQYGGDYMPQEAVRRNFKIINDIIQNGVIAAPPKYAGGGLFALTGINGADVKISPKVTSITTITTGTYLVGLNTSTVGFGINATLYFGDTLTYPRVDSDVEELSLAYTGNSGTWNQRKVDTIGGMGGSLVDGAVISDRSPIQSFVYDAFTQLTQGGRGIRITNNGYAQLVSVFTIFCSTAVQVDNGGIASVVNSNANFGDICLLAKGYGYRSFSGTVYNPTYRSYPFSPLNNGTTVINSDELDQYYPNGFWPNRGTANLFLPDTADRPHIGQIMEIIPPDGHLNEQSFPGFLNAQPSTSTLTTSSIILTDIDTTGIAIGNNVYIRDQYGSEYDKFPNKVDNFGNEIRDASGNPIPNPNYLKWYATTGTIVTDINYNSISLNLPLGSGGGDITNPEYFTLYFCGNAYYTVVSSTLALNPYKLNENILSGNTDPNYEGTPSNQILSHYRSINFLGSLINKVVANIPATPLQTSSTQVVLPLVSGGVNAQTFINQRIGYITGILTATNITIAKSVVPSNALTKKGTIVSGAGSAVTLINSNIDFLAAEVAKYVELNESAVFSGVTSTEREYILSKCKRDTKLIAQRLIYDLQTGGNYNSVMTGLSYWSRAGTYHVVELGEAVTRNELFPDGSTANFYQRSYISASGYMFEYVGAGTNYGALPQVGRADPVQGKETVQLDGGKVFFTSTDQNGDFRIGPGLVISQATGVLSGRTFTKSLFANMTPFILAIEGQG
jgi:hypothetical protein